MANTSLLQALKSCEFTDYNRVPAAEGSRWRTTFGVLKANIGKVFIINILTVLFFLPMAAAIYLRGYFVNILVAIYPFASNIGPAALPPNLNGAGMFESLSMTADLITYAIVVACTLIAAVGVAGATYSLRRMVNTQGEFTVKGYFHGVRKNYFAVLAPMIVFMLVFYGAAAVYAWKDLAIATGANAAWPVAATVLTIILAVVVGIVCMWSLAVGVAFKAGPAKNIRGAFFFLTRSILLTLIMLAFCFIPVWLMLIGGLIASIVLIAMVFVGFVFIFASWMSFTQGVFDTFIMPTAADKKPQIKTESEIAREKEDEKLTARGEILAAGRSEIVATPMQPISVGVAPALGSTFSRGDVAAAMQARLRLEGEVAEYKNKHKGEKRYSDYEKMFKDRNKPLPADKKNKDKSRVLPRLHR